MRSMLFAVLASALLVVACGEDDSAPSAAGGARTIEVEMQDLAFSPTEIEADVGETIRLAFENTGKVVHEAYIGDAAAQADHAAEMDEMDEMDGMDHDEALVLEPGERGELTYTVGEGPVQIGCHQPGHFEAGMVLDIDVR